MSPGSSRSAQRLRRWIRWACLIGCGIWVSTMLVSGLAKLWNPWPAVAMSVRIGIGGQAFWVILVASLEVATAFLLLCRGLRDRLGLMVASTLAVGILVWRFVFAAELRQGCGCFGGWEAPDWLAWTAATCGFLACSASLATGLFRQGINMRATGRAAALALVLLGGSGLVHLRETGQITESGLADLASSHDSILMIGSVDCPHCREALTLVERAYPDALTSGRLRLITREDDRGRQALPPALQSLSIHRVSSALWWKLVETGPPQFYISRERDLLRLSGIAALMSEIGKSVSKPDD